MKPSKTLLWGAAAVATAGIAGALSVLLHDRSDDARIGSEAAEIARLVPLPADHHRTAFDAVRTFVQAHSSHDINKEFLDLRKARAFTTAILAHAAGDRETLVPMECATRSALMGHVLRQMGYQTRRVALFDTDTPNLKSHSFLEVLNPATGAWETQDPDYDIYWRDRATGERASVFDNAGVVEAALEPCGRDACGWTENSSRLRGYFDILTVRDQQAGTRRSVYASHANPDGPFTHKGETGTFCDVMAKRCADGFGPAS